MSTEIEFGVWSPDEATFWQSWIVAGICSSPGVFTAQYPGVTYSTQEDWAQPMKPGFRLNVLVTGPLVAEMTYGLNQYDENGVLLDVLDRTWAKEIFGLIDQPADPVSGFPAGCRNGTGVTYCDVRKFATPTNVRQ